MPAPRRLSCQGAGKVRGLHLPCTQRCCMAARLLDRPDRARCQVSVWTAGHLSGARRHIPRPAEPSRTSRGTGLSRAHPAIASANDPEA
jgi:hypothetical protein